MRRRRPKPFTPPKDIKQWWLAPHCGPGTLDAEEHCGFCGRLVLDCARDMSEAVRLHPERDHYSHDETPCGGSGFWCSGCGRFWAQDSCGESYLGDMHSSDGAEQVVKDDKVYCVCGKHLATYQLEDNDA